MASCQPCSGIRKHLTFIRRQNVGSVAQRPHGPRRPRGETKCNGYMNSRKLASLLRVLPARSVAVTRQRQNKRDSLQGRP